MSETQMSQQTVMVLFKGLCDSCGVLTAQQIINQHYPYAKQWIDAPQPKQSNLDQFKSKPHQLIILQPKSSDIVTPKRPTITPIAKVKTHSKLDQARELFHSSTDKSRKAIIQLFIDKIGLSPAAASTYFYSAQKK